MSTRTVTVGDREIPLRIPTSYAVRYDLLVGFAVNPTRAWAAALGLCWTGPGRPGGRYGHNVAIYGGNVIDELVGRGIKLVQLQAAGLAAFDFATDDLVQVDEVAEEEGNSEAGGEASSA